MLPPPYQHAIQHGMFVRSRGDTGATPKPPAATLLWIHGLGESGLCFEAIAAHPTLARWCHLVPDLPGYGRSPWPPQPLGLVSSADLLAHWLAAQGAAPVVAVGHSLGGVVAQLLAERHPECVRAVVDIDGNLSRDDCVFSGQAAAWPLKEFLKTGFHGLREQVFQAGINDWAQRGYYVSLRLACPRTYHLQSTELVALSSAQDLAARLVALPVPHVYIGGVPRGVSPHSRGLLQAAGVHHHLVQPSGHWPFLDQPDTFAELLARFLEDEVGGAHTP